MASVAVDPEVARRIAENRAKALERKAALAAAAPTAVDATTAKVLEPEVDAKEIARRVAENRAKALERKAAVAAAAAKAKSDEVSTRAWKAVDEIRYLLAQELVSAMPVEADQIPEAKADEGDAEVTGEDEVDVVMHEAEASPVEETNKTPEKKTNFMDELNKKSMKEVSKVRASREQPKESRRKREDEAELDTAEDEEVHEAPQKKAKKAKPAAPYAQFKEAGSIPEVVIARNKLPVGAKSLKAIAWNVGGLRMWKTCLPELVRREQPDVLGLLEHKLSKDATYALPGYETAALHSGMLILLRKDGPQVLSTTPCDLPSAPDEGRLTIVELEELFVVVVHAPNSGDSLQRLSERTGHWDVQLREKLEELQSTKPTLLLGDLDVAHRDEDIWNGQVSSVSKSAGTTTEERESFALLLAQGFVDGFAQTHPKELGAFTHWSTEKNREKNRGLRLDYAIASSSLKGIWGPPALVDVFHMTEMATGGDHCPVGALLSV